jgi:hypothetical protein
MQMSPLIAGGKPMAVYAKPQHDSASRRRILPRWRSLELMQVNDGPPFAFDERVRLCGNGYFADARGRSGGQRRDTGYESSMQALR